MRRRDKPKEVKLFGAEANARALRAAVAAANTAGLPAVSPVALHRSRHISALLPELSIVARIVPATAQNIASGTRELAVSRFLHRKGAPVVAPLSVMPPEPYIAEDMTVTFWPHIVHEKADHENEDAIAAAARALRRVHDALADYPGELPSYKSKIEECESQLRNRAELSALPDEDRIFLMRTYDRLMDGLAKLDAHVSPIHGDAHLGNVFFTPSGPLWTDFEAASIGPREWDASGMPYLPAFPAIEMQVLALMANLRSLCVSVWCWALAADPEKRAAAECHLERLKEGRDLGLHL